MPLAGERTEEPSAADVDATFDRLIREESQPQEDSQPEMVNTPSFDVSKAQNDLARIFEETRITSQHLGSNPAQIGTTNVATPATGMSSVLKAQEELRSMFDGARPSLRPGPVAATEPVQPSVLNAQEELRSFIDGVHTRIQTGAPVAATLPVTKADEMSSSVRKAQEELKALFDGARSSFRPEGSAKGAAAKEEVPHAVSDLVQTAVAVAVAAAPSEPVGMESAEAVPKVRKTSSLVEAEEELSRLLDARSVIASEASAHLAVCDKDEAVAAAVPEVVQTAVAAVVVALAAEAEPAAIVSDLPQASNAVPDVTTMDEGFTHALSAPITGSSPDSVAAAVASLLEVSSAALPDVPEAVADISLRDEAIAVSGRIAVSELVQTAVDAVVLASSAEPVAIESALPEVPEAVLIADPKEALTPTPSAAITSPISVAVSLGGPAPVEASPTAATSAVLPAEPLRVRIRL